MSAMDWPALGVQGRYVHAVTDGRVVGQLGEHYAGPRVPDEHGPWAGLIERAGDRRSVIFQSTEVRGVRT